MKKKVLKVIAFIIATAGVIFLLLLYNSFNGNFIAKEIATRHMKEYLKTHHTELAAPAVVGAGCRPRRR